MADELTYEFRAPTDKLKRDLQDARASVRQFTADAERDTASFADTFNGLLSSAGSKLNTGLKVALGDFGLAVDKLVNITEAGLKGIPVVGEGIAAAYREVSGTLLDATERGIAYNDSLKKQQIQLGLVADSAADVRRELTEIGDIAFRTNVSRGFLVNAVEDLQLFNVEGRRALDLVRALATQATATGGGEGRVAAVTDLIERVLETGRVDARVVRQFVRNKIPIYDIVADELQVSKKRAEQLITSGTLSGDDFITVLTHAFTGPKWTQAAEEMTQTVEGMTRRYNTAISKLLGVATQPVHATTIDFLRQAVDVVRGPGAAGVATNIQSAISPITGLLEATGRALAGGDFTGGALKLGADIKAGLAKGVTGAGLDFAKSYLGEFAKGIGAQSPATEFIPLGVYAAQGWRIGFLAEMQKGGGIMGLFQGGRGPLRSDTRSRLEAAADDPTVRAFFEAVRRAEGGAPNRIVGGGTFSDFSRHPNRVGLIGPAGPSTAAGSYQITATNWRRIAPILGLTDFAARNQLLAALYLFNEEGGLDRLMAGDIQGAIRVAGKDWAGVPGSPLPGRQVSRESFLSNFRKVLGAETARGGFNVSDANPSALMSQSDAETAAQFGGYLRDALAEFEQGKRNYETAINERRAKIAGLLGLNLPDAQQRKSRDLAVRDLGGEVELLEHDLNVYIDSRSKIIEGYRKQLEAAVLSKGAPSPDSFDSADRVDYVKKPVYENGQIVGYNAYAPDEAPPFVFDPDLAAGLQAMAESVGVFNGRAKDSGVYIEGIGDVAQNEVIPALKMMYALMLDDQQAVQDFGQRGGEELEKVRARVNGVGQSFRELGFTSANMKGIFESSLDDAFSHVREGWRATLKTIGADWGIAVAQMVLKAEAAKLADKLFGSGGSSGGGLFGALGNLLGLGGGKKGGGTAGGVGNLIGGLGSLLGIGGSSAATASPAAASTILGGVAPGAGIASVFGGGTAAALFGGGGGAALGLGLGGSSAAGGTAAAGAAGSGGAFGSLGALFTNPWTAVAAGGIIAGIALWKHFGHRTEKELRKAIQQARGVDVRDMGLLGQIKALGEQAFGRGQVRAHLAETINLPPVQEMIDNYAAATGQGQQKQQLPHEFLYNTIGGSSTTPIAVNGNTLLPSPFAKGSALAGTQTAGATAGGGSLIEKALAPILDYMKASDRGYQQTTGAVVAALHQNTQAVSRLTTLPAGVIVKEGASDAREEIATAFMDHAASDGKVVDDFARMMRVP